MLVHKGGQINNVQLITGLRIAEMSQLQNCTVSCVQRMEVIVKMKKERQSQGGGGMCTKNVSYCEKEKKSGGGGGQGKCERRSEAFVKIQNFFFFFFFFWGGGGGSGWGGGGQGGCELRSEARGGTRVGGSGWM